MNKMQESINEASMKISEALSQKAGNMSLGEATRLGNDLIRIQRKLNQLWTVASLTTLEF